MKIVVMGGSFNPPTIAHLKMMRSALDQLEAEKGFFVPTADKSLRRKMRRAGFPAAWEGGDRFHYITPPEGILNISSTLIREKMRNNEPGLEELLHPCVTDMIRRDN